MKKIAITLLMLCNLLHADLLVGIVAEAALPHSLSPRNFDNSEKKFDNSVKKFDNSDKKFNNTSKNFENSPRKFENTARGTRSIVIEKDGQLVHVGYYATNEDGVTNFFSPEGERLFFSPPGTSALFHSTEGHFCGAIGKAEGKTRLLLTEEGKKGLLMGK
jgi:hypothetical protein